MSSSRRSRRSSDDQQKQLISITLCRHAAYSLEAQYLELRETWQELEGSLIHKRKSIKRASKCDAKELPSLLQRHPLLQHMSWFGAYDWAILDWPAGGTRLCSTIMWTDRATCPEIKSGVPFAKGRKTFVDKDGEITPRHRYMENVTLFHRWTTTNATQRSPISWKRQ